MTIEELLKDNSKNITLVNIDKGLKLYWTRETYTFSNGAWIVRINSYTYDRLLIETDNLQAAIEVFLKEEE